MWGITTDAEAKQAIAGDTSSDEIETGLGNIFAGLTDRPVGLAFSRLCPVDFASQPPEPFIDLKTRGFEWGLSWLSPAQDPRLCLYLFGKEHSGLRGMSWNFGSSWTAGKTLETFHSIGSPDTINPRSPDGNIDSLSTECSYLGRGRRRADVVQGYFALRHRIAPHRMTAISCGEVRPCAERRSLRERPLKRLVECKVLIRWVGGRIRGIPLSLVRGVRTGFQAICLFLALSCVGSTDGA